MAKYRSRGRNWHRHNSLLLEQNRTIRGRIKGSVSVMYVECSRESERYPAGIRFLAKKLLPYVFNDKHSVVGGENPEAASGTDLGF